MENHELDAAQGILNMLLIMLGVWLPIIAIWAFFTHGWLR